MKPVTAIPPAPTKPAPPKEQTTADILIAAKKLIEDPERWCGTGWGRNGRRCALHALGDASGLGEAAEIGDLPAFFVLRDEMGGRFPGAFNDTHTHAEVMEAFDRAIYRALEF